MEAQPSISQWQTFSTVESDSSEDNTFSLLLRVSYLPTLRQILRTLQPSAFCLIRGGQPSLEAGSPVWSMMWRHPDVSASVTNLNLNLVVNLTSLQQTWPMLFTPWRTRKNPPFSIDQADAVVSVGLKDAPTSICYKVTDAITLLEFELESNMINCNSCSFNILWRTWTFFSSYRNLKTLTTT